MIVPWALRKHQSISRTLCCCPALPRSHSFSRGDAITVDPIGCWDQVIRALCLKKTHLASNASEDIASSANFQLVPAHGRLADDVQRGARQQRVDVQLAAGVGVAFQARRQSLALLVEDVEETLQDLEMEGRRQQPAARPPAIAWSDPPVRL